MKNLHRRTFLLFSILVALVAIQTFVSANHSWGKYHWARTSNPFTVKTGNNVTSAWSTALSGAVSDWTASDVLNLSKVTGSSDSSCSPTSGRVEVCNASYGSTGWLGVASIWTAGGRNRSHIVQGTVKLNDTYFNTPQYNTPAWRALVTCQEVGHTLGLDHQDTNFNNANLGTCMDYTNDPSTNQHPNAHDYEELDIIYSHLDSTTTVTSGVSSAVGSGMPPAMKNIDFSSRATWGQLVSKSAGGHVAIYEQDFGGGYKVITRVIFANPTQENPIARERQR